MKRSKPKQARKFGGQHSLRAAEAPQVTCFDGDMPIFTPPAFRLGQLVKLSRLGEQRSIGALGASHAGLVVHYRPGYVTVAQTVVVEYAEGFWEQLLQAKGKTAKGKTTNRRNR